MGFITDLGRTNTLRAVTNDISNLAVNLRESAKNDEVRELQKMKLQQEMNQYQIDNTPIPISKLSQGMTPSQIKLMEQRFKPLIQDFGGVAGIKTKHAREAWGEMNKDLAFAKSLQTARLQDRQAELQQLDAVIQKGGKQAEQAMQQKGMLEKEVQALMYQSGITDEMQDWKAKGVSLETINEAYKTYPPNLQLLRAELDSGKDSAESRNRENKIQDYMQTFNVDRATAIKHVDKQIKLGTDELGRSTLVDTIAEKRTDLFEKQPEEEKAPEPKPLITPEDTRIGTGPGSNLRQLANNLIGFAFSGIPAEKTEISRNKLKLFNQTIKPLLMVSDRGAIYEQKNIEKLLPDPNKFFQDPDAAAEKLNNLREYTINQRIAKQKELDSGLLSPTVAKEIQQEIVNLETASKLFEAPIQREENFREMPFVELQTYFNNLTDAEFEKLSEDEADIILQRLESGK